MRFTTFLDIQEQNTCFYGCLNLSLYIFIRKIISMAFRFVLLFHFNYDGVTLLSFWLNRYPCWQAFWKLIRLHFEIRPFALLPAKYEKENCYYGYYRHSRARLIIAIQITISISSSNTIYLNCKNPFHISTSTSCSAN